MTKLQVETQALLVLITTSVDLPTYPLRDLKSFLSKSSIGFGITRPLLLETLTLSPSSVY